MSTKLYYDGPACPKRHPPGRYWSTHACATCAAEAQRMYRLRHPEKHREIFAKQYAANPERHKRNSKNAYARSGKGRDRSRETKRREAGLPMPTRPCPEGCENCGRLPTTQRLHLDHCHETGKFRGWLCSKCNAGLGQIGDNEFAVLRILSYLRRANAS